MFPIDSSSRLLLNQSTQSSVAYSTASIFRQGPRRRITSVLYKPLMVSARALSVARSAAVEELVRMGEWPAAMVVSLADRVHTVERASHGLERLE